MFANRLQREFCEIFGVKLNACFRRDNGVIFVAIERNGYQEIGAGSSFYDAFMTAETLLAINKH